jgi:hypothetical protein
VEEIRFIHAPAIHIDKSEGYKSDVCFGSQQPMNRFVANFCFPPLVTEQQRRPKPDLQPRPTSFPKADIQLNCEGFVPGWRLCGWCGWLLLHRRQSAPYCRMLRNSNLWDVQWILLKNHRFIKSAHHTNSSRKCNFSY